MIISFKVDHAPGVLWHCYVFGDDWCFKIDEFTWIQPWNSCPRASIWLCDSMIKHKCAGADVFKREKLRYFMEIGLFHLPSVVKRSFSAFRLPVSTSWDVIVSCTMTHFVLSGLVQFLRNFRWRNFQFHASDRLVVFDVVMYGSMGTGRQIQTLYWLFTLEFDEKRGRIVGNDDAICAGYQCDMCKFGYLAKMDLPFVSSDWYSRCQRSWAQYYWYYAPYRRFNSSLTGIFYKFQRICMNIQFFDNGRPCGIFLLSPFFTIITSEIPDFPLLFVRPALAMIFTQFKVY